MDIPLSNKPKSNSIIVVVAFAIAGFLITSYFLNTNMIQYASLPETISFKVRDGAKSVNDSVLFTLPVKSRFAIDTVSQAGSLPGKILQYNILYHQNPYVPVWGMLILVMVTIASASVPVFVQQATEIKQTFSLQARQIWIALGYAVLITIFLALSNASGKGYYNPPDIINDFHILFKNGNIFPGIVLATIILIIPAMVVMFLVGPSSDTLLREGITKDNAAKIAGGLDMLNQVLRNTLYVLSVIVVFSVLTSGTLKETIKATVQIVGYDIFPTEVSYAYGIFFSLFLCVVYMPVYFYLKRQYSYFKTVLNGMEDFGDAKEKLLASLDFKSSALDNLKTAITMLAPFITSFLPENLHFIN